MVIDNNLFDRNKITILVPYRHQARVLREILRSMRKDQIKISDNVRTADSSQGDEDDLVIVDLTIAQRRQGGLGFMQDSRRLNVAFSRQKYARAVFADPRIVEPTEGLQKKWAEMSADQAKEARVDFEASTRWLRTVFDYFTKANRYFKCGPSKSLFEANHAKWSAFYAFMQSEFERDQRGRCRICGSKEHVASALKCCRKCKEENHVAFECTEKPVRPCKKCGSEKHVAAWWHLTTCHRCGRSGHTESNRDQPDLRPCHN